MNRATQTSEYKRLCKEIEEYLMSTMDDKYEGEAGGNLDVILSDKNGKGFNIGNAKKYVKRYLSDGYEKSGMRKDLLKTIHYCIFELMRIDQ